MNTEGFASATAWVQHHYPGCDVVDAEKGLLLTIIRHPDIDGADRKDPLNCPVSRCGKRQEGAVEAVVIRSVAILVYPKDGIAVRYSLHGRERQMVRDFDLAGTMPEGEFWLAPIYKKGETGAVGNSRGGGRRKGQVKIVDGVRNWI